MASNIRRRPAPSRASPVNGSAKQSVSRPERTTKCIGIPMPTTGHLGSAADLHHDGGQQDRKSGSAGEHEVEEGVARVVVVVAIATEGEVMEEVAAEAVERRIRGVRGEAVERGERIRVDRASGATPWRASARPDRPAPGAGSPSTRSANSARRARTSAPGSSAPGSMRRRNAEMGRVPSRPCTPVPTSIRSPTSRPSSWPRPVPCRRSPSSTRRPIGWPGVAGGRSAPGDHVAICMENHPRYLEVAWGCHYAGAVYTATSSRLTSHEPRTSSMTAGPRSSSRRPPRPTRPPTSSPTRQP